MAAAPHRTPHLGTEAQTNSGLGTGVNLRGLGAGATLVLMNGRRIAPSGTAGVFVDIDNIPLAALERVDMLADSASALYGADAVGGVINLIMRDNFTGAETLASSGIGTHSTLRSYLVSQTIGHKWDDATAMLAVEFYRRDALPADQRAYTLSNLTSLGGSDFDVNFGNPGNIGRPNQLRHPQGTRRDAPGRELVRCGDRKPAEQVSGRGHHSLAAALEPVHLRGVRASRTA